MTYDKSRTYSENLPEHDSTKITEKVLEYIDNVPLRNLPQVITELEEYLKIRIISEAITFEDLPVSLREEVDSYSEALERRENFEPWDILTDQYGYLPGSKKPQWSNIELEILIEELKKYSKTRKKPEVPKKIIVNPAQDSEISTETPASAIKEEVRENAIKASEEFAIRNESSNVPVQKAIAQEETVSIRKTIPQEANITPSKTSKEDSLQPEAPKHPLELIQEKYKAVPLHEANKRFRRDYLTEGRKNALLMHYQDKSLDFSLEEDEKCDTAYINLATGQVRISKSIALACMDGKRDLSKLFNYDALNFLIHHELSHFKDLVAPDESLHLTLPNKIQAYQLWLEKLDERIWEKWEKEFVPVFL